MIKVIRRLLLTICCSVAVAALPVVTWADDEPAWSIALYSNGMGGITKIRFNELGALTFRGATRSREVEEDCGIVDATRTRELALNLTAIRAEFSDGSYSWASRGFHDDAVRIVIEWRDLQFEQAFRFSWPPMFSASPLPNSIVDFVHDLAIEADRACASYDYRFRDSGLPAMPSRSQILR